MRRRRGGRSGVCGAGAPSARRECAAPNPRCRSSFARSDSSPRASSPVMRPRSSTSTRSASAAMKSRFCSTSRIDNPRDSPEPGEDLRHVFDDRGLDTLGGLVEQEKRRVPHQASRQGQKLLLAAREHLARSVEERLEPGEVDQQRRERGPLVAVAVVPPREVEVLPHRQPRKDPPALRHVSDAEPRAFVRRQVGDVGPVLAHGSGVGGQEAHQGLEERGLPHAVVAEDAHNLALADIEVDAVQNRDTAVPAGEPPRLQGDDPFLSHRPPVCPDRRRAPSDPSSPGRHGRPSAPLPGERP